LGLPDLAFSAAFPYFHFRTIQRAMKKFENKRVLVTGAGSGIGRAVASALLDEGAAAVLVDIDGEALEESALPYLDKADVRRFCVDLGKPEQIYGMLKTLREEVPDIHILVHCAGVFNLAPVAETGDEILERNLRINFMAPFILTRELSDTLAACNGHVVFINSTAADQPKAGIGAYASSKAALKSFAEVYFQEVYSRGIRVSSIYPGRVATPMQQEVMWLEGRPYDPDEHMSTESLAAMVVQLLTLPPDTEVRHLTVRPPLR
jgi:NAD(P)-dependent dehydrogenase (short-subunit alcohol dehydrogenase family)